MNHRLLLKRACFGVAVMAAAAWATAQGEGGGARYIDLPAPQLLDLPAQAWEGDQQPHTFSVLELNRGGFRYWAWYGLNHGRGMGLARSNDLLHWSKYEGNPLWTDARWPSVLKGADPAHPGTLYFAITRDYDTPSSRIVLATSEDGIHLTEQKTLVARVEHERNQNPNLFRDPVSGRFYLTFYRGNDENWFDIVSRNARRVVDLDAAPDTLLMHSTETVAAPTLMYLPHAGPGGKGIYYLATEIYPNRYKDADKGDWQVKVFHADRPDGAFEPVAGNPVEVDGRACLFQHLFEGRFYGYQCKLDAASQLWQMEVVVAPLPR
ncbi:MAG: hypothetical protein RL684_973 [Pseudomonadota bacterium]|jgi:hypothetical protein